MFPYWTIVPIYWQHDSTCICTPRLYVIVNLNINENHVQYVHSKTDDPRGSHSTQFESFLIISTKTGKKSFMTNVKRHFTSAWKDVWARWESHRYARHFQRYESPISWLLNRFKQIGNVVDQPRSGRQRKTMPWEDRFLTTSFWRNRFLSSRKSDCLPRNSTGTRVWSRSVRNRLHAARLIACRPYVGILRTCQNYRACCCTVFVTT